MAFDMQQAHPCCRSTLPAACRGSACAPRLPSTTATRHRRPSCSCSSPTLYMAPRPPRRPALHRCSPPALPPPASPSNAISAAAQVPAACDAAPGGHLHARHQRWQGVGGGLCVHGPGHVAVRGGGRDGDSYGGGMGGCGAPPAGRTRWARCWCPWTGPGHVPTLSSRHASLSGHASAGTHMQTCARGAFTASV
jgi:hypothetical protein